MSNTLNNYNDFIENLLASGFSLGSGNNEGIYAIVDFNWLNAPVGSPIIWHSGDRETDPWEWRIRVLNERSDISYAKCFFKKSGYIIKEFYPYFLSLRRGGRDFEDDYADGLISNEAKRIYSAVCENGELPLHEIKASAGFGRTAINRGEKGKFDAALIELQMRLYLTICATHRRVNAKGEEYGWDTTMFCTTEHFWDGTDVFDLAAQLDESDAYATIRERVLQLNPAADEKRIRRFAYGQ